MEIKNVEILRIGELKTFKSGFKCVELIKFNKVGDKVDVGINLLGREWTNNEGEVFVFNTLEAWKVFKAKDEDQTETKLEEPVSDVETDNDLPF